MPTKLNTTYISEPLAEKLSHIAEYPVTAVVAPMGYGKTRAISWWAEQCRRQRPEAVILRQSLATESLTDFWRGFCRSLRPWPELKTEMEELGFPVDSQARGLMLELLWDALGAGRREIFYGIDDLHVLPDPALGELLLFLGERLPETVHLVLLSRNLIFHRADRLRLGARLLEIGAEDLRLSETGILEYARACGMELRRDAASFLAGSTEGWFSMVYLNLKAYQQQGRWPQSSTGIYPLIDEALFQPLRPRQRAFLVRLGLPDAFTDQEAAFLWPDGDAPELLAELTAQNAFITCSDGVYRYHNLLRFCAREKFARLPEAEKREELNRLGRWYEQTGEICLAAECYESAGNWDALLGAVGQDRGLSLGPERLPLARRWMAACPEQMLLTHPQAILVFLLLLFYARDISQMRRYHALFQKSMDQCREMPLQLRDQLEGEALLRLSFLSFNDITAMSRCHRQIRALIPADRNPWTQGSPSVLALYHSQSGALDRENREMRECMAIYSPMAGGHGSGAALVMEGETALLRGKLADAAILCHQAEAQALEAGEFSIFAAASFLKARLERQEGTGQGVAPLDHAEEVLRRHHQYRLLTTVQLGRGWMGALDGQTEALPAWLTEDSGVLRTFPLIAPIFRVVAQQIFLARGRWAQAAAEASRLLEDGGTACFTLCCLYANLQRAAALQHLGKEQEARQALTAAWELARPDGLLLPFAQADPALDGLLEQAADPEANKAIRQLAESFRAGGRPSFDAACLTPREREIAGLAAERKSSREIAEILCISVKSVDNRLNTVYEKLGLGGQGRNKRQALIQWAKGAGL